MKHGSVRGGVAHCPMLWHQILCLTHNDVVCLLVLSRLHVDILFRLYSRFIQVVWERVARDLFAQVFCILLYCGMRDAK